MDASSQGVQGNVKEMLGAHSVDQQSGERKLQSRQPLAAVC